jgi:hypothetical protein
MNDKNDDPNLEHLNQQIWELRRHLESATTLIGGLLLMILVVLILQSWQIIVGVFLWSIGVLTLIVKASLPFTDFLREQTGLSFMALLSLTVIGGLITFFVINVAVIFFKEWSNKRVSLRGLFYQQIKHAKKLDDKNMSTADSMRRKREADLDAEMKNYFDRKQAYLKEAEQYLTAKRQDQ